MGHAEMRDAWEALDTTVEQLPIALREHSTLFGLQGEPTEHLLAGPGEPHALLAIAMDGAGIVALSVIPLAKLDDRLATAFATIDGRTFAGAADLTTEQWDAAVLVMAALAHDFNNVEDFTSYAQDEGATVSADDLAAYWQKLAGTGTSTWADLERPITRSYRFRRAQ
jgi:hypothetical protein